jgi:hypothetical protein
MLCRLVRFDEDVSPVHHEVASTSSGEQVSHRMPGAEGTSLVVPAAASDSPWQRRCHRFVGVEDKTLGLDAGAPVKVSHTGKPCHHTSGAKDIGPSLDVGAAVSESRS